MTGVIKKTIIIFIIMTALNAMLMGASIFMIKKITENTFLIENEIAKLNKKHLEINSLRENLLQIKEIEKNISTYEKHIFTRENELSDLKLIEDLETIAQKNNIIQKIMSSNFDDIKSEKIEIVILIGGMYTDALNYLNDLENYKFFINIEKIELTPQLLNKTGPDNPTVNLRLKLSLYAK